MNLWPQRIIIIIMCVRFNSVVPGSVSSSLNLEHSAWYSHVLLGLTSGGGVQQTLSFIPVANRQTCLKQSHTTVNVRHGVKISRTIHHISLLHVPLTTHVFSLPANHRHMICHYSNLRIINRQSFLVHPNKGFI